MKTSTKNHQLEADGKTQESCGLPKHHHFSLDELFAQAKRHWDEVFTDYKLDLTLRRSGLIKAKFVGQCLIRAKALVKENGDKWLPVLRKKFGHERNAQICMQIARRWGELAPLLKNDPNLAIDGAVKFFNRKEREPESDEIKMDREVQQEAKKIFGRCWPILSNEELKILRQHMGWDCSSVLSHKFEKRMREVMNGLRWEVRRILEWRDYRRNLRKRFQPLLSKEELCRRKRPEADNATNGAN